MDLVCDLVSSFFGILKDVSIKTHILIWDCSKAKRGHALRHWTPLISLDGPRSHFLKKLEHKQGVPKVLIAYQGSVTVWLQRLLIEYMIFIQ